MIEWGSDSKVTASVARDPEDPNKIIVTETYTNTRESSYPSLEKARLLERQSVWIKVISIGTRTLGGILLITDGIRRIRTRSIAVGIGEVMLGVDILKRASLNNDFLEASNHLINHGLSNLEEKGRDRFHFAARG